MLYMTSWTMKPGGSAAENEESAKRALAVFSKWSPAAGQDFKVFVQRVDGRGGYALVETDDPKALLEDHMKFSAFMDFDVHPVVDMTEAVPVFNEAIEFLDSIG